MHDTPQEYRRGNYLVSTDRRRLDVGAIHDFLSTSYWAAGMPRAVLERAIANSVCFGIYDDTRQVGFGRVITDLATFAYLSDVFVLEPYRGRGLSAWLLECMRAHPELQGLRRWALFTRDAQRLYARFGFGPMSGASEYMEIREADVYRARTPERGR